MVDESGNIAVIEGPAAVAQDVACACRLFAGELWYDTTQGLPYFESILGRLPSAGFLMAKYTEAALGVPGVEAALVTLDPVPSSRTLTGRIDLTLTDEAAISVAIGTATEKPWYVTAVDAD